MTELWYYRDSAFNYIVENYENYGDSAFNYIVEPMTASQQTSSEATIKCTVT